MISIVMPYFNRWDLCHSRLAEFYKFFLNKYDIEIVMINDASTEKDCASGVKFWQGVFNRGEKKILRYHENDENLGFGGSMNMGMRLAHGDIMCLYSNDVVMTGDWLGSALNLLGESNQKVLLGGEVLNGTTGWNEFTVGHKQVYFPYANGWLLMFWDKDRLKFDTKTFGKFDVEDIDFSTQAREMGYNLVALNSPYLRHIGGATIWQLHPDRQEYTTKNIQKFIAKWQDKFLKLGIPYEH